MKKVLALLAMALFWFPALALTTTQININTASLAQLDQIAGVGPAIGQRIIDARPYASLDDLLRVSGIGPKTLQKIKDQGLAFVTPAPLPKSEKSDTTGGVAVAATKEATKNILPQELNSGGTANPWFLFLGVLGTAIIMGAGMLFLKLKVFKS